MCTFCTYETYDRYLSARILTLKMRCWHGSMIKSLRSGVRVVEGLLGYNNNHST